MHSIMQYDARKAFTTRSCRDATRRTDFQPEKTGLYRWLPARSTSVSKPLTESRLSLCGS